MITPIEFDSAVLPAPRRLAYWTQLAGRSGWRTQIDAEPEALQVRGAGWRTSEGFVMLRLESSPQQLYFQGESFTKGIWIGLVLEGSCRIHDGVCQRELDRGALFYGALTEGMSVQPKPGLKVLLVQMRPTLPLAKQLGRAGVPLLEFLDVAQGPARLLGKLLAATANDIETLPINTVPPLESAITEFFLTCLAGRVVENNPIKGSTSRSALLRRAYHAIERKLHEPDLGPHDVAAELAISARYVQKLFRESDEIMSLYIRRRRLERVRDDLMNGLHAHQGISEICFRWGFNDAAYFSRAFKAHFGISPSEHRQKVLAHDVACREALTRRRHRFAVTAPADRLRA